VVLGLCRFAPPLRDPTFLEMASLILFAAVLTLVPLRFSNPLALIGLGLTGSAVIIIINFSFDAYWATVRLGLESFNQEARNGLMFLFPSSVALMVAGGFRSVAPILRAPRRQSAP
jgi:hypothetical protein